MAVGERTSGGEVMVMPLQYESSMTSSGLAHERSSARRSARAGLDPTGPLSASIFQHFANTTWVALNRTRPQRPTFAMKSGVCGLHAVIRSHFAKVRVAGSSPVFRSKKSWSRTLSGGTPAVRRYAFQHPANTADAGPASGESVSRVRHAPSVLKSANDVVNATRYLIGAAVFRLTKMRA